jgi:superfamily II DNA or RNA helicase
LSLPVLQGTEGEAMSDHTEALEDQLGKPFFDYQREAIEYVEAHHPDRLCFYYPTGKGKTLTSLISMLTMGSFEVLIIAPPATHPAWYEQAEQLGMEITCVSHAKFRQKNFAMSRRRAVIADEFHLFGGHTGQGWKKLKRLGLSLEAPLILMSATPNYNDAERVYCIESILQPQAVAGGFIQFLYNHCRTEQNPFGMVPKVIGFQRFTDAAEYLAAIPNVLYLPDELVYTINDVPVMWPVDGAFETFGYDSRTHRIMASQIEARHRELYNALVTNRGYLNHEALTVIRGMPKPVLVFATHATVAEAAARSLPDALLITGKTSEKLKAEILQHFRDGKADVLIGTATLATGTDGLDKVCDTLVILDDTDDAALRRQLIGRIMPRGADGDATTKHVYRIVPQ